MNAQHFVFKIQSVYLCIVLHSARVTRYWQLFIIVLIRSLIIDVWQNGGTSPQSMYQHPAVSSSSIALYRG